MSAALVSKMPRSASFLLSVLALLLLLGSSEAADALKGQAESTELYQHWRFGTLSRIANLLALHEECKGGESPGSARVVCYSYQRQNEDQVSLLRSWAEKQSVFPSLLEAAQLHLSSQSLFEKGLYLEAEEAVSASITLQLFPFQDRDLQERWLSSVFDPLAVRRDQRKELADSFILLAATALEAGYNAHDLRKLLKSHFALDTANEIFLLDYSNVGNYEYMNILHMDILGAIEETIPLLSSEVMREIVFDLGWACEDCDSDFDYKVKIMEVVGTGMTFNMNEEIRAGEVDRCKENQILQQSTSVIVSQLSMFLASPLLSGGVGAMLKELDRPCYGVVEGDDTCMDFFPRELLYRAQCIDADAEGNKVESSIKQEKKKAAISMLSKQEKSIASILTQNEMLREQLFQNSQESCENPNPSDQVDNYPFDKSSGQQKSQPLRREEEESKLAYDYRKEIERLEKDLHEAQRLSVSEPKGDDPIVPITLFFMLIFYFGFWMTWKNRKALMRRIAKYEIWNKEFKRENSQDTALLRVAMSSGDIAKLEDALSEVNHADPAVMRRARTLLAQKKKAKKEADVAKAKAKAAKQRASAIRKGERSKKTNVEPISTAATIAAVRAKVERERERHAAESPKSEVSNTMDSSVWEEDDFMPVGAQRKRATTTGSLTSGETEKTEKAATYFAPRKNSDTSASNTQEALVLSQDNKYSSRYSRKNSSGSGRQNQNSGVYNGKRGKSFDKGNAHHSVPTAAKGQNHSYSSFRRNSGERMNNEGHRHSNGGAEYGQDNKKHSGGRKHYSVSTGAGYRLHGHYSNSGNSATQQPKHSNGSRGQTNYSTHNNHNHVAQNWKNPVSSINPNAYGSSLYQTDLVGSLVGSYSAFKANGGGSSRSSSDDWRSGNNNNSNNNMSQATSSQYKNESSSSRLNAVPAAAAAAASIPKHMRANSFPEVEKVFDVDLTPSGTLSSESKVEWLPSRLIDSLSKE